MLTQLHVRQFAIVNDLSIDLTTGMTAITGETGAGKSIALDALGLCLGARADTGMVRSGAKKAEITAVFDISSHQTAQKWLHEHELDSEDECILRRTLSAEGRSKAFINGAPVPVALLKEIGRLLVNIHGQHEHQLLTQPEHQLNLLDSYACHASLLAKTRLAWQNWQKLRQEQKALQQQSEQQQAREQLLRYQVTELQEFALQADEFEQIEAEHRRLAHASTLRDETAFSLNSLYDGEHNNAFSLLQTVIERLSEQQHVDSQLEPIVNLLSEAGVQVEEAVRELRHYHDDIDVDPAELSEVEQRLTSAMQLAKKHQISPETLPSLQAELEQELAQIRHCTDRAGQLEKELDDAHSHYLSAAHELSKSRQTAADELSRRIAESMAALNMKAAIFEVAVNAGQNKPGAYGVDDVSFLVTTNPGQPLQPLSKVASGGELSRISLAIQVITANQASTPTLMFDEVDVGVSGPTAATVGKLLRKLGESTQVICVTHLPQVAAKAHQQMCVQKIHNENSTETSMTMVTGDERVIEIARLLGGDEVTDKAKANAQDLLVG